MAKKKVETIAHVVGLSLSSLPLDKSAAIICNLSEHFRQVDLIKCEDEKTFQRIAMQQWVEHSK